MMIQQMMNHLLQRKNNKSLLSNLRVTQAGFLLVSLDVEINPRFYRGKKKERSYKKEGELDASRKTKK